MLFSLCLDELLGLRYIIEKFQVFSLYLNFNISKFLFIVLDVSQAVHESVV